MVNDKQMVEFLDSNGYYGLDEMVSLLADIANGVYESSDFIKDVKEYGEHTE